MPPRGARTRVRTKQPTGSGEAGGRYGEPEIVEIETEAIGTVEEPVNILLYGPSGVGKTRLAAAAPRSWFLTTEKGVISAKHTGSKANVWRAPTWPHCFSGIKKAEATLKKGDWLIVDSVTKMQQLMLEWILQTQAKQSARRDLDLPEVQDHQKWQNMFRRFIDKIYDLECNCIVIANSMIREDKNGDDEVLPELIGGERWVALSHYMCYQAGVVLYYYVSRETDDEGRRLRYAIAQPDPPYMAKDRYDALGVGQYVGHNEHGAMAEFIDMIQERA